MDNILEQYLGSPEAIGIAIKVHRCVLRRYMLTLNGNGPNLDSATYFLRNLKGLSITTLGAYKSILQRFLSWYFGCKVKLDCPWITDALNRYMKEYYANKLQTPDQEIDQRSYYRNYYRRNYVGTWRGGNYVHIRGNKRVRPDACELCGKPAKRLNYHHWDDSNLRRGMWVCYQCHIRVAELIDKNGLDMALQLVERYVTLKTEIDLVCGKDGQG